MELAGLGSIQPYALKCFMSKGGVGKLEQFPNMYLSAQTPGLLEWDKMAQVCSKQQLFDIGCRWPPMFLP